MSRICVLLLCLAVFSQVCSAQKKKNKGKKKNKAVTDGDTPAEVRFEEDSSPDSDEESTFRAELPKWSAAEDRQRLMETEDLFSTEYMRDRVDRGVLEGFPSAANIASYKTVRLLLDLEVEMKSDVTGVDEDNRFLRLGGHVDIYYEKQNRSAEEHMILDSWGWLC